MNTDRQRIGQLTEAVEHRTTIGKALGILMERFELEDDAAFDYLVRCSQAQNRKLYDVAVDLVATRRLPAAVPFPHTRTEAPPASASPEALL